MADPQTKMLIVARLDGFNGVIHKINGIDWKRLADVINVPRGDGSGIVDKLRCPAWTMDNVTLEIIVEKSLAFISQARNQARKHKLDPNSAGPITVMSLHDDGSVEDLITLVNACIESVKMTDGDVTSHGEAIATITCSPTEII